MRLHPITAALTIFLSIACFRPSGGSTAPEPAVSAAKSAPVAKTDTAPVITAPRPEVWLRATVYHASGSQTDASPLRTADGSRIHGRNHTRLRWVALSPDLMVPPKMRRTRNAPPVPGRFRFGDTIFVHSGVMAGWHTVHDVTNPKLRRTIDFLVSPSFRTARLTRKVRVSQ